MYVLGAQNWDGSFEYPQHMFWLRNKKNIFYYTLLHLEYLEAWIFKQFQS